MRERVRLRVASIKDAPSMLKLYTPYVENTAITFEHAVPNLEEFTARLQAIMKKYPCIVAEGDGQLLGYAYASNFKTRAAYDWAVETTVYVRQDCKRGGIGRKLYEALEKALRLQGILNANACIAYTEQEDEYLTNDSTRFHERLGYVMVAHFHKCGYKHNRWYDMIWMEKHLGEHLTEQPPVKPFPEVQERFVL